MTPTVNRRRLMAALGAGALLPPLRSLAAEPPLIGYLLLQPLQPTPTPERQAFLDGLRAQGLIEGRATAFSTSRPRWKPTFWKTRRVNW